MSEENPIRGPDEEKARELREEIMIMISFRELVRQDMCEFVKNHETMPFSVDNNKINGGTEDVL